MFDLTDIQNIRANEISNAKIEKLRAEHEKTKRELADAERELLQLEHKAVQIANAQSKAARNARTHRLITRGAIAESFIANAETLTNDEFKAALTVVFRGTN